MTAAVRASDSRDLPALAKFLTRVYKLAPSHPLTDPRFLEWKYVWPRPGWNGSRSYILEKDGEIVSHCGVCPATLRLPGGEIVPSLTMVDWAADPATPGAGFLPFRKLMGMADTSFAVGAINTRAIVVRLGFREVDQAPSYSAWVRPWGEFRARPVSSRSMARLLHGWTHPAKKWKGQGAKWEAVQTSKFDSSLEPVLRCQGRSWTTCVRTIEDLNYLLRCPHLPMTGLLLRREGQILGYCVVGRAQWEIRVLDMDLCSGEDIDWTLACGALTQAIRLDREACRIRALATTPILRRALSANGYWAHSNEPIFIYDPKHVLDQALPIALQLFDGDSGY